MGSMERRRRVLVVEDNGDNAFTLKLLLEAYGFEVAVAGDGEVGLMVARQWFPDFVLLDIGLPGIDGYEVARKLHDDPQTAGTTVIGISAYDPGTRPECEQAAGFAVRLVKPVSSAALLSALGYAVDGECRQQVG
jgi:CheY-like chemotaxis protein